MTTIQVCRTCLAHDTRMYRIANTPLQCFYEKITNLTLNTQDESLSEVCYICYHLLKKCQRFTACAVRANDVLQQISKSGIQITKQFVASFEQRHLFTYYKTPVTHVNAEKKVVQDVEIPVVKTEVEDSVKIKVENEEMAVDATECFVNNLQECPIRIDSSSDTDVPQSISIKKEHESFLQESDLEKCGQGVEAVDENECSEDQEFVIRYEFMEEKIDDEEIEKHSVYSVESDDNVTPQYRMERKDEGHWQDSDPDMSGERSEGGPAPKKRKSRKKRTRRSASKEKTIDNKLKKATEPKATSKEKKKPTNESKTLFTCKFCEKTFPRKISLTNHVIKLHTGVKPFSCNYCERKFKKSTVLQKHTLTHLVG